MKKEFSDSLRRYAKLKRLDYNGPTELVLNDSMFSRRDDDKDGAYGLVITKKPVTKFKKALFAKERTMTDQNGYIHLGDVEQN